MDKKENNDFIRGLERAIEVIRNIGEKWGNEKGLTSNIMKGCAELIAAKIYKEIQDLKNV